MSNDDQWIGIYRDTVDPLYRFVSRRTGGLRQLSEDVVQESYLRAIGKFGRDEAPRQPLAWLQTVARHLLASHYRRMAPVTLDPAALDALLESDSMDDAEAVQVVQAGLARIGAPQARLLEAFHLDGMDVRAIAQEWGISERAVEGRLRRARQTFRRVLLKEVE